MGKKIKSIRVGDVFEGKLISVGKQVEIKSKTGESKKLTVSSIVLDLAYLKAFGIDVYNVYVKDEGGLVDIWQSFSRQPVCLTYDWE